MGALEGKAAVITGGGQGTGLATAPASSQKAFGCSSPVAARTDSTTRSPRSATTGDQPTLRPKYMALLTHPWVFVLWFAAFRGVVLITAGLIGSSR